VRESRVLLNMAVYFGAANIAAGTAQLMLVLFIAEAWTSVWPSEGDDGRQADTNRQEINLTVVRWQRGVVRQKAEQNCDTYCCTM